MVSARIQAAECPGRNNDSYSIQRIGSRTASRDLGFGTSPDDDVAGYRLYYGTASQIYTVTNDVGNVTTNTVSGLVGGVTYFFAVRAYNTIGLESDFSNEVSYTPRLSSLKIQPAQNGQVVLEITGESGCTYDVLASQTFTNWATIGAVSMGDSSSLEYIDTNASIFPSRCYRLQEP